MPFSFASLGLNRFRFKFSKQEHIDRIQKHITSNVNGCLLSLQQWYPKDTMGELSINTSPFWIQVHGLPLANMSLKNFVAIGKCIGLPINVDVFGGDRKTFRSYLRILDEINVFDPLKPGFSLRCDQGETTWISFKYERLDFYCTTCDRIGYKHQTCCAPLEECFQGKYFISLRVNIFSNLPHSSSSAWGYAVGVTLSSQPSSTQKTTQVTRDKYLNTSVLTPTIHNPLKNLSLLSTTSHVHSALPIIPLTH